MNKEKIINKECCAHQTQIAWILRKSLEIDHQVHQSLNDLDFLLGARLTPASETAVLHPILSNFESHDEEQSQETSTLYLVA